MTLSQIISKSLNIAWQEKLLWLFAALPLVVTGALILIEPGSPDAINLVEGQQTLNADTIFLTYGIVCLAASLSLLLSPLSQAGQFRGVLLHMQGKPLNLRGLLAEAKPYYWRLLVLPLLLTAFVLIFYIALIALAFLLLISTGDSSQSSVPAVALIFLCCFMCMGFVVIMLLSYIMLFAMAAIVVDNLSIRAALSKSIHLVRTQARQVFAFAVLYTLILMGVSLLFSSVPFFAQVAMLTSLGSQEHMNLGAWLRWLQVPQLLAAIPMSVFYHAGIVLQYQALKQHEAEAN